MNLVTFVQDESGQKAGYASILREPSLAYTDDGDYRDFFSRPIKIYNIDWTEGGTIVDSFSPWKLFFQQTAIVAKMRGYSRMRANLKLRFLINGSPFRYGDILVSYKPLWAKSGLSTYEFPFFSGGVIAADIPSTYPGGTIPGVSSQPLQTILARSQRPHIHLYPQTNAGGDMTLPFIYPQEAVNIYSMGSPSVFESVMTEMGTISLDTIVPLLTTATPNVSTGVTISVFAWAEDIMLWGPTNTTINGGDEFDQTTSKPSAIASTVATMAGQLSSLPVIGPYATATSMAAGGLSDTLRLFGLSNPPVVSSHEACIPKNTFINPSPIISEPLDVLALDPKNEQTIDPTTVGCRGGQDELSIESFCARPAILDTIVWYASDTAGTVLGFFPVTPHYARCSYVTNTANPSTNNARITMTPATYIAQMFRYWRGTMRLHMKVICSNFHRGRLCVSWDPTSATADATGTRICKILDLASADEITVDVPYLSHLGYLNVSPNLTNNLSTQPLTDGYTCWGNRSVGTTLFNTNYNASCTNGNILVTVLNDLQSGDTVADVRIVVSVSFPEMELSVPVVDTSQTSSGGNNGLVNMAMRNLTLNGGEEPTGEEVHEAVDAVVPMDPLPLVYSGEKIVSLRTLLHRTYFYRSITYTTTSARSIVRICWPRFPQPKHARVPVTFDSMTGTTGTAYGTNLNNTIPLAYITGCFIGYRGAIIWNATTTEGYTGKGCYMAFLQRTNNASAVAVTVTDLTTLSTSKVNQYITNSLGSAMNGATASCQSNNGTASAVLPMYSNYKMFPANMSHPYIITQVPPYLNAAGTGFDADYVAYTGFSNSAGSSQLLLSTSGASDFSPVGFLNCPDIYFGVPTLT